MHVLRTNKCCSRASCCAAQVQYGNSSDALMTSRAHAGVRCTLNAHYTQSEAVLAITLQRYMKGWPLSEEGSRRPMTTYLAVQVQFGNASDASTTNRTHARVRVTLTMHYPQPEMAPSEQAAIANIYSQCVSPSHPSKCICAEAFAHLWYVRGLSLAAIESMEFVEVVRVRPLLREIQLVHSLSQHVTHAERSLYQQRATSATIECNLYGCSGTSQPCCRCCNSTDSCKVWKSFNSTAGQPLTDFCKIPGKLQDHSLQTHPLDWESSGDWPFPAWPRPDVSWHMHACMHATACLYSALWTHLMAG